MCCHFYLLAVHHVPMQLHYKTNTNCLLKSMKVIASAYAIDQLCCPDKAPLYHLQLIEDELSSGTTVLRRGTDSFLFHQWSLLWLFFLMTNIHIMLIMQLPYSRCKLHKRFLQATSLSLKASLLLFQLHVMQPWAKSITIMFYRYRAAP